MATQQGGTPNIFNINPNDPKIYKFLSTPGTSTHFAPSKYDEGFLPGGDLEEYRSQRQSWQDKLGNGLAKFTSSAFTGALESTVGAVYGATSALVHTDSSKFWDNEFSRSLDGITESVNEMFPHYYSEAEKSASALGSMAYGNFWFDKALGSAGYTVGALMVGLGASKVFQMGKAARLAALGEEAMVAESAASQTVAGLRGAALKKTAWDVSKELGLGMTMAHGESAMEARQTADQTKQFYEEARALGRGDAARGIAPDVKYAQYANMSDEKIKQLATDAGNTNYLMNLAITGGTNLMLLGKFLPGKKAAIKEYNQIGQRAAKAAETEVAGAVEKTAAEGATEYFDKVASKKYGALLNPLRAFGAGFVEEGGQEGFQYASNIASQEFVKKHDIQKQGWWSSMLEGLGEGFSKTLTDKEGLESILLGGVTGGPFGLGGARAERLMREENTRQLVDFMNNDPNFKNANSKITDFLSSVKQVNEAEDYLKQGDHFNAKNKSDQALNTYLKSIIDNGAQDYFITRLESLKTVGDEELAKHFGEGTKAEDIDKIIDKVGELEKLNDDLITLYGISGGTKEQQIYNAQLRDRLFFSASTIKDEEKRITAIQEELRGMGNTKIDNLLQLRQTALTVADTIDSYPVDKTKTPEEQKAEQKKYLEEVKQNAFETYNNAVEKFEQEHGIEATQAFTLLSDLNELTNRKANFIEYYNALNDPQKAIKLKEQEDGWFQANEEVNQLEADQKNKQNALSKTTISSATKAIKLNSNRESRITYKDVDTDIAKYDTDKLEELNNNIEQDIVEAMENDDFATRAKLVEANNKVINELEFRKNTQAKVDEYINRLVNATPDQIDGIVKDITDAGFEVDPEYIQKLKDSITESIKVKEEFENKKRGINAKFKGANEFYHAFLEKNATQAENLREAIGRPEPTKLLHFVVRKEPNGGTIVNIGDNTKVKKRVPDVVIEIWSGGVDEKTGEVFRDIQVGVMPWYGQYVYPDGTAVDIQNLTEEQYKDLFQPNYSNPEVQSLEAFKAAQRKMQALYTDVSKILGDKSSEKIFPGKVKSLGDFSLTGGTFNFTSDDTPLSAYLDPNVPNKPYMINGAPVVISTSPYDGTSSDFSYSQKEITTNTPVAGILDADGNNVVSSAFGGNNPDLVPALNTLKQRLTSPKVGEGIWNKYWMLVEDPAGTIQIEGSDKNYDWRPVTPNILTEVERTSIFEELTKLAESAIADKDKPLDSAKKEENKRRAIAANESIFVALSTGTQDKQYKNASVSFGVGPNGMFATLDLQFTGPLNVNGTKVYQGKIYLDIPASVKSFEDFITFFNNAIKSQQVLKFQGKIGDNKIQGQVNYSIGDNIQPLTLKSLRKNFRGEGDKKGIRNINHENVWDSFSTNVSIVQPRNDQKIKFTPKNEAASVIAPATPARSAAPPTQPSNLSDANKDELTAYQTLLAAAEKTDNAFELVNTPAFSIIDQDEFDAFIDEVMNDPTAKQEIQAITALEGATTEEEQQKSFSRLLLTRFLSKKVTELTNKVATNLSSDAALENVTPEEFEEVLRLSEFFLDNPREPGVVGDARSKFPNLFKALTERLFSIRQLEADLNNRIQALVNNGAPIEEARAIAQKEFDESEGGKNAAKLAKHYNDLDNIGKQVAKQNAAKPAAQPASTQPTSNAEALKRKQEKLNSTEFNIKTALENGMPEDFISDYKKAEAAFNDYFVQSGASRGGVFDKKLLQLQKEREEALDKAINISEKYLKDKIEAEYNAEINQATPPTNKGRGRTGGKAGEAKQTGFYSEEDTIKLDAAIQNLARILPPWIKVEELRQLASSLRQGKITFGSFYNNVIKLSKYAKAGTEFHEAFHAIFRTLLTDAEQDALYAEAKDLLRQELKKQGKNYYQGFAEFKKERPDYAHLSEEVLKKLYLEEWMADEFAKYTQGKSVIKPKTISAIGKLIQKFFDLIGKVTRFFKEKPTLQNLFADIETGKFRNDKQKIKNRFSTDPELNEEAHSAIYVGDSEDGQNKRFLKGDIRLKLENTIASNVLANMKAGSPKDALSLISEEMTKLGQRFDVNDEVYDPLFSDARYSAQAELIQDLDYLFNSTEDLAENSRELLLEGIKNKLKEFNVKEFDSSADETVDGEENTTERSFDLNNENKGGFTSLSKDVRKYISTTVYTTSLDEFLGLPKGTLFPGQEITVAVNPKKVYDGLVKICANQANPINVLRKMWYASKENTEGAKFLYKFFEETGVSFDETGELRYDGDKAALIQSVVKAFNLFSVDYIFTQIDRNNKDSRTFLANRKDVDYMQVQNWQGNFSSLFKILGSEKLIENANNIKGLDLIVRNSSKTYEEENIDLNKVIDDLHTSLADVGIKVSKMFLRYALLANPNRTKTAEQLEFIEQFEPQVGLNYQQIFDYFSTIRQSMTQGINPFIRVSKVGKEDDSVTRAMKLAKDNAVFDEEVFVTSMINADNKNIYPYQQPNYHVQKIKELNNIDLNDPNVAASIHSEKPNQDYLQNNYLLKDPVFQYLLKNLAIERIDGIKQTTLKTDENGEKVSDFRDKDRDGVTYGGMTDREVWLQMYSLYADNSTDTVIPEFKEDGKVVKTKRSVRRMIFNIMEASNTADVLKMSVKTLFVNNGLTKTFIDAQVAEVQRELDRIERVKKGEYTDKYNKFNAFAPESKQRGRKFWENAQLLESIKYTSPAGIETTLKDALEQGIVTLEEVKPTLEKGITAFFAAHLKEHEKELIKLGILDKEGKNHLLHSKFEGGAKTEGDAVFTNNFRDNLFNAYLNMYLNNTAINQVLMGDPALTLKDSTDWFKRARGNNASGPNMLSFTGKNNEVRVTTYGKLTETGELDDFTNDDYVKPKERIIKIDSPEWEEFSKELSAEEKQAILDSKRQFIKVADAQCQTTVKGFTKFMDNLGKLTPRGREIYKRIEDGGTVEAEDWKYLKDHGLMMNSLKLVYYDGTTYIKMSVVPLTKDLTTDSDGYPRRGYEFLHNMRVEMERNNVDMIGQPSMMKKMIKNPVTLSSEADQLIIDESNVSTLSAGYLRLQQENPSNKIHIKDPTQMLQIIAAEQDPTTEVILPDGTPTTVGAILEKYDKGLVERVREQYKSAREFMFPLQNGKRVINMKRGVKVFKKLLEETGASQQLLDYLETDDQGNPIENLNAPSVVTAFEQHFNAYFNKVLSQKIPGYKVTLQAQFGMSPVMYEIATGRIITRYEYNQNPSRYRDSSKYGVRKLAYDQPRMVNGKETHRYSEVMIPYHFAEQFGLKPGDAIPEELAYMFGVRIPSQDKHSALVLKVVDVLPPYYGSNMIGPDELILLTGSDFDIDSFYIHRMDHYIREGKLVPYGNKLDSKWSQYKRWNKDNNTFLNDLMDELSEDDEVLKSTSDDVKKLRKKLKQIEAIEASIADGDISDLPLAQQELLADKIGVGVLKKAKEKELEDYENALLELALRELKLPYNEETFNKSGIRSIGEINNEILLAKMILHTNSGMTDINKTPATLEAIENVLEQLAKTLGYAKWQDLEKTYNPNTPLGMIKAFTTNKAGQAAIGAATNNTINYSILSRFGIKIRSGDDVRNVVFSFKNEQGEDIKLKIGDISKDNLLTEDGVRIMDILSTFTSSMTDNTKYGYNSKMNIDINTLSVASLLSMNKVPLLKIGYMLKSEYIVKLANESREYAIQTEAEGKYKDKADARLMNQLIKKLVALNPGMSAEDVKKLAVTPITDEDLSLSMEHSPERADLVNMTEDEREEYMQGLDEVTRSNYYIAQLKILSSYSALTKQTTELIAFSQIVRITKGISSSTKETSFKGDEDLKTYLKTLNLKLVDTPQGWVVENGDAKKEDLPLYNFKDILNKHLISLENLNIFADKNELQQGYFVSQTKFAQNIRERISKALRTRMKNKLKTKAMTSLRRNLESYLMIKAWKHSLTPEEKENLNSYLYVDAARKAGIPTLEELKHQILEQHPELENSIIFTQVFFKTEGNKMEVQYNTRTKGNKGFEGMLLDEMRRLQNSPALPLVKALTKHLLAKNALQFKNNSPVSLLPPATLRALFQFSGFIDEFTPELNTLNDDRFKAIFGGSVQQVSEEFEEFFLRDIENSSYLNYAKADILTGKDTENTKTPVKKNEDGTVTFNLDENVQNIKEDTEITNEEGEVVDIIDNTNKQDADQRKRNFAVLKSANFIPTKVEYTKKSTDKDTKVVTAETKKASVFKFPKIIKIGNTLYKLESYVPAENRYKEKDRLSTTPNENGEYVGTQVTYKPVERFIGPYGKTIEENEEYTYEKIKSSKDTLDVENAAEDAEDYPDGSDTELLNNAPDINTISTAPTTQIDFKEDQNTGYAARTQINASADATIAIAVNFDTAGEKLTKNSVLQQGKKYIARNLDEMLSPKDPFDLTKGYEINDKAIFNIAEGIVIDLNSVNAKTLNIAGNGIYTMKGKYSQELIDNVVERLLEYVIYSDNLNNKNISIRTGGQTGFDEAGAKAGIKLGIPTTILAPKGWKFRDISGTDISNEQAFKARFATVKAAPVQSTSTTTTTTTPNVKTYEGRVETLTPNQVFVFGSNPEGRHGAGTAQLAKNKFGAKYGQGRGIQGQAYALVTKNLTPGFVEPSTGIKYDKAGEKSVSREQIIENIDELYQTAMVNPAKEFLVAYGIDANLNGYTPQEMADMFSVFPIPSNVVFNKEFAALLKGNTNVAASKTEQLVQKNMGIANATSLTTSEAVNNNRTLLVAQILGTNPAQMKERLLGVTKLVMSGKLDIKNIPNIVMKISQSGVVMSTTGLSNDGRTVDQVVRDVVDTASDEEVLELHKLICKI